MSKEIIIVQVSPVFKSFVSKWCIDELYELKYQTTILDVSPVLRPDLNAFLKQERLNDIPEKNIVCTTVNTKIELLDFVKKNRDIFFITMFYNDSYSKYLFYCFRRYNIKYGNLSGISSELGIDDVKGEISLLKRLSISHLKGALYNRLLKKYNNYLPQFLAVSSSQKEEYQKRINMCDDNIKILRLHSYDYENYLRAEPYLNDGKPYCVFLDPYIPFHPDLIIDANRRVNPQKYYEEMRHFFDIVSNQFNCEVIVASHPRADIDNQRKYWAEYNVIYGKTAELVKGANIVLTHFSNSTAIAVMAYKPIIIIANDELRRIAYFHNRCKIYANLLSTKMVYSPDEIKEVSLKVEENYYRKFIIDRITYIERESPCFWEEIINCVESCN